MTNWAKDQSIASAHSSAVRKRDLEWNSKGKESAPHKWKIAWCHHGDAGGSKRAAFEMVRELSKRGHIIDEFIIRASTPNLDHFPLKPFVRHSSQMIFRHSMPRLRPYVLQAWASLPQSLWRDRQIWKNLAQLAETINQEGYDIVHLDHYSTGLTVYLLPFLRLPTILYSHEASKARLAFLDDNKGKQGAFLHRWYSWFCEQPLRLVGYRRNQQDIQLTRQAQLVLTNSHYSKEGFFQRYGCLATVCNYGVDIETFRPLSLAIEPMVLSVGRVVRPKQHHVVIEAVGMIEASWRPRVVITTPEDVNRFEDPFYSAWLTRLAREKEVELEIRQTLCQNELAKLYNQAIALVFVPIMEPFGLVALEAMACGTPVIGVREAGIRESVIDGVTGILVERDSAQIATAIEYLQQHKDVRTKMSRQAVDYIRASWTWERTIDRYEHEVSRLL